jgi:hypothetical protein
MASQQPQQFDAGVARRSGDPDPHWAGISIHRNYYIYGKNQPIVKKNIGSGHAVYV